MKRTLTLLLIFILLLAATSCKNTESTAANGDSEANAETSSTPTDTPKDTAVHAGDLQDGRWFDAVVISTTGSLLVMPYEGTWEASSALNVGLYVSTRLVSGEYAPAFSVGDHIRITYNGLIAESCPAQVLTVYAIEPLPIKEEP